MYDSKGFQVHKKEQKKNEKKFKKSIDNLKRRYYNNIHDEQGVHHEC